MMDMYLMKTEQNLILSKHNPLLVICVSQSAEFLINLIDMYLKGYVQCAMSRPLFLYYEKLRAGDHLIEDTFFDHRGN